MRGRATCPRCGAATTDPVPSDADLDRAYARWYRPDGGRFAGPGDLLLRRSRSRLARRLDRIAPPGRILDVGAGDGTLVAALKDRGRVAVGLERAARGPDIVDRPLADLDGEWAAIVFWHSLEHLRDAGGTLAVAAERLAFGGLIVVAMPNSDSLQAHALGDCWLALDLPRHLVHVPASALLGRLRDLGLRIDRVSHLRGGQSVFGWLHGLVGAVPGTADLYDSIRLPAARQRAVSPLRRAWALAVATLLLLPAAICAVGEAALRRGGSIYVEARRV
jgi:hypothetical protein